MLNFKQCDLLWIRRHEIIGSFLYNFEPCVADKVPMTKLYHQLHQVAVSCYEFQCYSAIPIFAKRLPALVAWVA